MTANIKNIDCSSFNHSGGKSGNGYSIILIQVLKYVKSNYQNLIKMS